MGGAAEYARESEESLSANENNLQSKLSAVIEIAHKPMGLKGEDAHCYNFRGKDLHAQAVFDGCGGAGAWKYAEFKNATGAFVAAQSAAKAFPDWFKDLNEAVLNDSDALKASYKKALSGVLASLKKSCAPMKVSGSLVKSFPCTASVALMRLKTENTLEISALNDGDSRVYCLSPAQGLVQLTHDDTDGDPDPMESLRDSAPMSDMPNADTDFTIKLVRISVPLPCAVMCASDGMFGFLRSPMDYEYTLLNCLALSSSLSDFETRFKDAIVKVTGDDSTCVMSFYGWDSFEKIKLDFAARYRTVTGLKVKLDAAKTDAEFESVLNEIWPNYKAETVF